MVYYGRPWIQKFQIQITLFSFGTEYTTWKGLIAGNTLFLPLKKQSLREEGKKIPSATYANLLPLSWQQVNI